MKNKTEFRSNSRNTVFLATVCVLFAVPIFAQTPVKPATPAAPIASIAPTIPVAAKKPLVKDTKAKAATAAKLAAAAAAAADAQLTATAKTVMQASFKERGQVKLDRLDQDVTQELCSKYAERGSEPGYKFTDGKIIEATNLKTLVYPADGVFLGDWKEGEKIAQLGVGKQFSDDPAKPSGGNCYACHQLDPTEISYGNLGPSLYQYGKLRGNTEAIQKYTYGKIYNSNAYSACSNMPRFGHAGILTAEQIKHVTALLLDPQSPVNAK
jgi:L-cysteine S-thiosulfotransferase